jgi:hypothetical protein
VSDDVDRILRNVQQDKFKAIDAGRFEAALVRHMLKRLSLPKSAERRVRDRWQEQHGERYLKFAAFNAVFSTFPFLMGSTRLETHVHEDPKSTEPARFKKFSRVPFVQSYEEFFQDVAVEAATRSTALVFPRRGFRYGLVIHNDESETYWDKGLCWVYKGEKHRLYVQPFVNLLDAIYRDGHGWRP